MTVCVSLRLQRLDERSAVTGPLTTLAMRPSMRPNDHGQPVVPVTHSVGHRMDCRYASIMASDR